MHLRRIVAAALLAVCATVVVPAATASAATPKPTPKQEQALCIARTSVELLKEINKQKRADPRATVAAIKAIPAKAKAACPLKGTTPTTPTTPTQPTGPGAGVPSGQVYRFSTPLAITVPPGEEVTFAIPGCPAGDSYFGYTVALADGRNAPNHLEISSVDGASTGTARTYAGDTTTYTLGSITTVCQKA